MKPKNTIQKAIKYGAAVFEIFRKRRFGAAKFADTFDIKIFNIFGKKRLTYCRFCVIIVLQ